MDHAASPDLCYRCGYDLRTLADEQPCPECGLLAARSRRPTDELHHTRPGWLRRLSWGVWLILLAMATPFVGAALVDPLREYAWDGVSRKWTLATYHAVERHVPFIGPDLGALLLAAGVFLLTTAEGYAPADHADRRRRRALRALAVLPIIGLAVNHLITQNRINNMMVRGGWVVDAATEQVYLFGGVALLLAMAPLPLLLFLQLRSLAKRARSAHLAEHCAIVGVGNTLTLLYAPVVAVLMIYAERWGFGMYWSGRSTASLVLLAALVTASLLFALWNVYLLLRFAIAFAKAARKLRREWRRDDLSAPPVPA